MTANKMQELQAHKAVSGSIKQEQHRENFARSLSLWSCLLALTLLFSIAVTAAFIRPLALARRQDLQQAALMRKQTEAARRFAGRFGQDKGKYETELARLEEEAASLERLLPPAQELDSSAVIAACCRAAAERQVQVDFIKAEPKRFKAAGAAGIGAYRIRMNMSGEFFRLQAYLLSLEKLQAAGCLCRWQQLKITGGVGGGVEAEGVLLAFVRDAKA